MIQHKTGNLGSGASGLAGDSTSVLSVLEIDEAVLSPVGSPAVTYDPVSSLAGGVSSQLDGVIDVGSALVGSEYTSVIVLPLGGITADGKRTLLEGLVDSALRRVDGDNLGDGKAGLAVSRGALSVLGGVGVATLGVQTSLLLDPLQGLLRITSRATTVVGVAVDDFLRGKRADGISGDEVGGLNSLGGGESPARSALLLVLDRGGHSLCDPVDISRRSGELLNYRLGERLGGNEAVHALELLDGPVGKLGEAKAGTAAVGVEFIDLATSLEEGQEALVLLLEIGMGLIEKAIVFFESRESSEGGTAGLVHQSG